MGRGADVFDFVTKDSGVRAVFPSGMRRDSQDGKPRYDLVPLGPLKRLAELMARGAVKYGDRNWEKANSQVEVERMKGSALRHLYQFIAGETDEDHGAAAVFNIFAAMETEPKVRNDPMRTLYDDLRAKGLVA